MAKGVLPELLGQPRQAWVEDRGVPRRGGTLHGHSEAGGRPPQARDLGARALTQVGVALAVVARHVGAAAPIALADAALVQRVGGEEHPVTADGLQEGRRRGCWEGAEARPRGRHRLGRRGGRQARGDRWVLVLQC